MSNSSDFYEAAHLDPVRQRIYSYKRTEAKIFANILIVSCQYDNWWYKDFIGTECFAMLHFSKYIGGEYLKTVTVVNLTNSKILIGRDFDVKDIIII